MEVKHGLIVRQYDTYDKPTFANMQPTASYIIHPYMVWLSIIYRLRELALPKTSRLELRIGASMIISFHQAVIAKGVNS